ncbi:MAG TPA: hypothetical protein VFW33_01985 [Gemmataceae bacterium]|nr:hypothetical protein [Gemmataceae bacterium]
MRSELRVAKHALVPGAVVVEVWHDGQFIGQVTAADGPGVRVLSKYELECQIDRGDVSVAGVRIVRPAASAE